MSMILPGTGRGTSQRLVEGGAPRAIGPAVLPLHHRFAAVPLPVPGRMR